MAAAAPARNCLGAVSVARAERQRQTDNSKRRGKFMVELSQFFLLRANVKTGRKLSEEITQDEFHQMIVGEQKLAALFCGGRMG